MIKFDTYRLLNESLGMYSLGVRPVQSFGIQSNMPGFGEAGLPPELSAKKGKGKPPFGGGDEEPTDDMGPDPMAGDMGGEGDDMGGADMGGEGDDMGGDEMGDEGDKGSVEDRIAELEAELAALKAEIGGGDEDDDADLDHEDDLGDLGDDEDGEDGNFGGDDMGDEDLSGDGEEGEDGDKPFGIKKKPVTPFMKKGMKKESCDDKDGEMVGKGNNPVFMMKKAKKCDSGGKEKVILGKAKKCDSGMKHRDDADDQGAMAKCGKNCKSSKMNKNVKKEATGYERPKPLDFSEDAWFKSIQNQLAQQSINQKFDNGMRKFTNEDLLLPPVGGSLTTSNPVPGPGEVGYAPTAPVGGDLGLTAEAVQDILSRLKKLENK